MMTVFTDSNKVQWKHMEKYVVFLSFRFYRNVYRVFY